MGQNIAVVISREIIRKYIVGAFEEMIGACSDWKNEKKKEERKIFSSVSRTR